MSLVTFLSVLVEVIGFYLERDSVCMGLASAALKANSIGPNSSSVRSANSFLKSLVKLGLSLRLRASGLFTISSFAFPSSEAEIISASASLALACVEMET